MAEQNIPAAEAACFEARVPASRRAGETGLELTSRAAEAAGLTGGAGLSGAGSLLRRALAALKSPKTLIPLGLITVLWILLPLLGRRGGFPAKLLAWLSFAQGGLGRSLPGALGGVLGRGVTACAWISLAWGGAGQIGKGAAALFRDRGRKRSLLPLLLGAAVGAALSWPVFAGLKTASGKTAMAGLAGCLLSLESLGREGGGLYRLALRLCPGGQAGERGPNRGAAESLLIGLTLGSALGAAIPAAI